MIKTTNYKLNMPEVSDALSIVPLNENTQKIDGILHGLTKMMCGSYTGSGSMSVAIQTPGMKPQALLVRGYKYSEPMISAVPISLVNTSASVGLDSTGFAVWIGQDIVKNYWIKDGTVWDGVQQEVVDGFREKKGAIVFTSANGSLSWTLSANPAPTSYINQSFLVNNKKDYTYEWIAFGTEV